MVTNLVYTKIRLLQRDDLDPKLGWLSFHKLMPLNSMDLLS